jgi:hypothetical protein
MQNQGRCEKKIAATKIEIQIFRIFNLLFYYLLFFFFVVNFYPTNQQKNMLCARVFRR